MGRLSSRLRIGEKIGLSFGLVGLLFLGVIWHYHASLKQVLRGYERLYDIYETRKSHALEIEIHLAEMRWAESAFLMQREEELASAVDFQAEAVLKAADALGRVDKDSEATAQQIICH